jgi:hypothetical protein
MGELVRHRQGRAHLCSGLPSVPRHTQASPACREGKSSCPRNAAPTCRRTDRQGLQYGPAVPLARVAGSVTCLERAGEAAGKYARTACPTKSKVGLGVYLVHACELPVPGCCPVIAAFVLPRLPQPVGAREKERESAARYKRLAAPVLKCSSAAFAFSLGLLVWLGRAAPRARECGRRGRRN